MRETFAFKTIARTARGAFAVAATFACAAQGAEWLGTGGDTLWGNADNWNSSTGVPTGSIAVSSTAGDNLTLTLDGDHEFSGTFNVTTGTQASPVVFNATAEAIAASNHVGQTSSNGFDVKSGGVLKIESGVYDWANDYRVSNASVLWMTGGRMTTKYWGILENTAQIKMEGGELVSGWRDGAEKDNGRLNMKGDSSIVMTAGRIRCSNNTNSKNDVVAVTIGDDDGTTSVSVSGGEIYASGKIHLGKASGSVSTLSVSGTGVVASSHDMRLGYGGADSTLDVADGGLVDVGVGVLRWIYFDTGKCTINLNGGTLRTGRINVSSTTEGAVNFNGGRITAEGAQDSFLPASDDVALNIHAGGAVIETDYSIGIAGALVSGVETGETDGGLVKLGSGTLTLSGENTYTGATIVEGGTLEVSGSLATTNLKLAGGAVSGVEAWNTVVITEGRYSYSNLPATLAASYEMTGGTLVMTAEDVAKTDGITNVVVKGGTLVIDGTGGAYSAGDTISINAVAFDGVTAAESVRVAGTAFDWTVSGNAATAAVPEDAVNRWMGGASGTWADAVNWKYGVPTSSQKVVFDSDAVVTLSQGVYVDTLDIAGHATVQFRTSDTARVHPSIHVQTAIEGDGTFQLYHAGFKGNAAGVTSADTVSIEILYVSDTIDSWLERLTINGPVKGAGYLIFRQTPTLNGDNSGLTFKVYSQDDIKFTSASAGSAAAGWQFNAKVLIDIPDDSTISFGRISINDGDRCIRVLKDADFTIEVGARDGETSYMGDGSYLNYANDWGWDSSYTTAAGVTLKKVGSNTLTCKSFGFKNVEVAEGELAFAVATSIGYMGSMTDTNRKYGSDTINSLKVAEGAVLSGTATQTISALALEPGAIVRQTITRAADEVEEGAEQTYTYSCPSLWVNGDVSVEGVKFDLVDNFGYLENAVSGDSTVFTLLSATGVDGTPLACREMPMATDKWYWLPRRTGTAVIIKGATLRPGFSIRLR